MAIFLGNPKFQGFATGTGAPLSGGFVYVYTPGTLTLSTSYPTLADANAGTNANTNPVELDSRGEATIVLPGARKIKLTDSSGTTIWTVDNVGNSTDTLTDSYGNSVIILGATVNAVNQFTVTNAATGGKPAIAATGSDTNVSMTIDGKGSGTIDLGTTSTGAINLKRNTAVTGTLSTSGAATLASAVVTAGATVGTTLGVTGATTLSSTLGVTGATTLSSTLAVTGTATFTQPIATTSLALPNVAFSADTTSGATNVGTSATKIALSTESFDVGGYFDSTTNYRHTPLVAGYYLYIGRGHGTNVADGNGVKLMIYKNGSNTDISGLLGQSFSSGANKNVGMSCSALVYMNGSTDYVELYGVSVGAAYDYQAAMSGVCLFKA